MVMFRLMYITDVFVYLQIAFIITMMQYTSPDYGDGYVSLFIYYRFLCIFTDYVHYNSDEVRVAWLWRWLCFAACILQMFMCIYRLCSL